MLGLGLGIDKIRPVAGGLLDLYPATAAYSLRALSSSTTNVVRVREDGSNNEQDFTAKEITDGTLASFCGANNGFVTTWYDQAGSNNASQATAGSQPKIYDSSTGVVLENGKPALDFDGVDDFFTVSASISYNHTFTVITSNRSTSTFDYHLNGNGSFTAYQLGLNGVPLSRRYGIGASFQSLSGSFAVGQRYLYSMLRDNVSNVYVNGVLNVSNAGTSAPSSITLFIGRAHNGSQPAQMTMPELIIYSSDQSSNRTAIESNINSHYNIYS